VVDTTLDPSSSDHLIYVLILLTPYTVLERFDKEYVGINLQPADLTSQPDKHPDEHLIKARWFLFLLSDTPEAKRLREDTVLEVYCEVPELEAGAWESSEKEFRMHHYFLAYDFLCRQTDWYMSFASNDDEIVALDVKVLTEDYVEFVQVVCEIMNISYVIVSGVHI
jgi:hypothetical protein